LDKQKKSVRLAAETAGFNHLPIRLHLRQVRNHLTEHLIGWHSLGQPDTISNKSPLGLVQPKLLYPGFI